MLHKIRSASLMSA